MSLNKIKIKTLIKSNNEENEEITWATLIENVISYQEKTGTFSYFDIDKYELIRENDQVFMKCLFVENKKTNGIITVKDINQDLEIEINTKKIIKEDNKYHIEYQIEDDFFIYEIEFMEVKHELFKKN
jgi:hypothetical protein